MKLHGICNLSLVPVRKEPSHTSEMVTQLLFGEHFTILESGETWILIKNAFDGYEGWIHAKQFLPVSSKTFSQLEKQKAVYAADLQAAVAIKKERAVFPVLMGSALPGLKKGKFTVEGKEYEYKGESVNSDAKPQRSKIIRTAAMFLSAPYLWGGKSEFGIDCSGFTQVVFKVNGVKLPRDAYQQATLGESLNFVEESRPGDLAFFDNEKGRITHVGIVAEAQTIIHASGFVRYDLLDKKGIFKKEMNKYTHQLRDIKRLAIDL